MEPNMPLSLSLKPSWPKDRGCEQTVKKVQNICVRIYKNKSYALHSPTIHFFQNFLQLKATTKESYFKFSYNCKLPRWYMALTKSNNAGPIKIMNILDSQIGPQTCLMNEITSKSSTVILRIDIILLFAKFWTNFGLNKSAIFYQLNGPSKHTILVLKLHKYFYKNYNKIYFKQGVIICFKFITKYCIAMLAFLTWCF